MPTTVTVTLSPPQARLLASLRQMAEADHPHDEILVTGHTYRTALALERRGLASVKYQGPSMGWARARTGLSWS